MLRKGEDYWIEYFDKCEKCGESVGQGIEVFKDKTRNETIHLCDVCFREFKNEKSKLASEDYLNKLDELKNRI